MSPSATLPWSGHTSNASENGLAGGSEVHDDARVDGWKPWRLRRSPTGIAGAPVRRVTMIRNADTDEDEDAPSIKDTAAFKDAGAMLCSTDSVETSDSEEGDDPWDPANWAAEDFGNDGGCEQPMKPWKLNGAIPGGRRMSLPAHSSTGLCDGVKVSRTRSS